MCEIYEYKNESLTWDLFDKSILSYKNWCKKYKLGKELFKGGEASIYSTFLKENNKNIIHLTKIYKYKNKRELMKIWQEFAMIRQLKLLNYPNIAFGKKKWFTRNNYNQIYMTMSKLNYTLNTAMVKKNDINIKPDLKYFILEIAANLHQLHSNNYVHLDIKPANCAFNDTLNGNNLPLGNGWKLIDFGLLKYIKKSFKNNYNPNENNIQLNYYIGTRGWTAPEISPLATKENPNIITTKSDIWSFGLLILYIINNGENIFDLTDIEKKKNNGEEKRYIFYKKLWEFDMYKYLKTLLNDNKINWSLFTLLNGMLKYDPKQRPTAKMITGHAYFRGYILCDWKNRIVYKKQNFQRLKYKTKKEYVPLIYDTPKFEHRMMPSLINDICVTNILV